MKRMIVKIDESRCNGCGLCVPSCKEGALKIVNGKAKLVSESYCDGLGACLGKCPRDAITLEEREALEFDEASANEHNPQGEQGQECDKGDQGNKLPCGCPGTFAKSWGKQNEACQESKKTPQDDCIRQSELRQWPIQLSLIPTNASYLKNADLVLLADCTAVAYANLHRDFIKGKIIAMACPKLDDTAPYLEKLESMIKMSGFKSIEVVMMEVPCCSGLGNLVEEAIRASGVDVWFKKTIIGIEGERK